jgi:large subunit ribosomal protein L6
VVITGPNIENVSQSAANLEWATRIKNKDSRVFLDGVYIYSKE